MELKKRENSSVELTLTLTADRIEEAYKKAMNNYAKKITIKGFRPGKAPISVIERKYGAEIREESTFKLMEENLEASYKELDKKQQPLPYSTPVLQNEDTLLPFKPDTDITYSVVYDVLPEFTLPEHTGLEIAAHQVKVTDDEVNREIEAIRQQNAMVLAKDGEIADGDIVTLDYVELLEDGSEKEDTKRDDFTFTVGSSYNFYKLDKDLIGLKKGDERVIEKTYGDDSGMGTDYLGRTVKIKVVIKEVKYRDVPELSDEFAQDVKEEYKTLDDMKNATRAHLEEHAEEDNRLSKLDALIKNISDRTEISLPESMINAQLEDDWRQMVNRFGMKEEDVEKLLSANGGGKTEFLASRRNGVIASLKGQLIIEKIKEEQNYQPNEDEINAEIKKYGEDVTSEHPNYEVIKMYAEDDIKYRKAQDYLLSNNTFTELKEEPVADNESGNHESGENTNSASENNAQ